jgi:hemolysin III
MKAKEEVINAATHGFGTGLSIVALVVLIVLAWLGGTTSHLIGFSIFGGSMVLLYMASTVYHGARRQQVKSLLRKVDHMSIYVLIAGTYTPFCLVALPGWVGWAVLSIVWTCALIGIAMKFFLTGAHEGLSTFLYVLMGWLILPAIKPLYDSVSFDTFVLLMTGGVFYTAGTYFFLHDHRKYFHSVWHLFVLAGSAFHFFSVLSLLN